MSADLLREAAAVARRDWESESVGIFSRAARIHLAVADWLEGVGERHVPMGHPMYGVLCCATCNLDLEDDERGHCDDMGDALNVARAYLDTPDRSRPGLGTAGVTGAQPDEPVTQAGRPATGGA